MPSKREKANSDYIAKLMIDGLPPKPESRATKSDLWKEINLYRKLLWEVRLVLLQTIVAQLRQGMNEGVTPEMLRKLADEIESAS
ncbi:hypothetical protein K227x_32870 [Rubripirellula lacrimiformis]|uniref:Uncharacterized protein n=1 Tax=Rubripirellula lacrimiformis TaxID=1930273 RepID=A0A517NCP2_9BACT|nr:hypothetical protein [Rubripirellula lacrimiformis]QDT04890.1 hypothetical protein K227x_32870 [Rubripirellula lacrimiformis]